MLLLGWIGSFCFAFCAVPQTIKTIKTGRADDFSYLFIIMWLLGEVMMFLYNIAVLQDIPLFINYAVNFISLLPIMYYKIYPRKTQTGI
jgi:uncharacterized protein with PQ loop repeat